MTPWPLPANSWFLARIPPPFATGSAEDVEDLKFSQQTQARATPEQISHANVTDGFNVFTFSEVLGPGFSAAMYPKTAAFFRRLEATANVPKNFLKDTFRRERPFLSHPEAIRRLVPEEGGFSYPSGHSTRSRLDALVLCKLDPTNKAALVAFGDQVAMDRVIGGMHYLSDVRASWKLGDLLFDELMKDPGFISAVSELKQSEWQGKRIGSERDRAAGLQ